MSVWVSSTAILTVWGASGPLVGVFLGHRLSFRPQRKQWVSDHQSVFHRSKTLHLAASEWFDVRIEQGANSRNFENFLRPVSLVANLLWSK